MNKGIECVGGASESDDFPGKCVGASDPVRGRRTYPTHPPLEDRLHNPDAFLSRTDLRELGLPRRAIDGIFRALPVIVLDGYSRPLIKVADYLNHIKDCTYQGDRVR